MISYYYLTIHIWIINVQHITSIYIVINRTVYKDIEILWLLSYIFDQLIICWYGSSLLARIKTVFISNEKKVKNACIYLFFVLKGPVKHTIICDRFENISTYIYILYNEWAKYTYSKHSFSKRTTKNSK